MLLSFANNNSFDSLLILPLNILQSHAFNAFLRGLSCPRLCLGSQCQCQLAYGIENGIETGNKDIIMQFLHDLVTTIEQILMVLLQRDTSVTTSDKFVQSHSIEQAHQLQIDLSVHSLQLPLYHAPLQPKLAVFCNYAPFPEGFYQQKFAKKLHPLQTLKFSQSLSIVLHTNKPLLLRLRDHHPIF